MYIGNSDRYTLIYIGNLETDNPINCPIMSWNREQWSYNYEMFDYDSRTFLVSLHNSLELFELFPAKKPKRHGVPLILYHPCDISDQSLGDIIF